MILSPHFKAREGSCLDALRFYRRERETCIVYPCFCSLLLKRGQSWGRLLPLSLTFPLLAMLLENHQSLCGESRRERQMGDLDLGGIRLGGVWRPHMTLYVGGHSQGLGVFSTRATRERVERSLGTQLSDKLPWLLRGRSAGLP